MSDLSSLLESWPIAHDVKTIDIEARWRHGAHIVFTVFFLDRRGGVLDTYKARCGSHLWHRLILPGIRAHCAQNQLACKVSDTTDPDAKARPNPRANR